MKVSLNWLKQYIDLSGLSPEEIGDILTSTGLEVEGIEAVESVPGGLNGIVIGEVVECEQHPNADRLSLTKVNVGADELLSIVCGAPNVAKGQKVLVATIGAELHPTEGDPFTIKKGKIRGEVSEGMICAEDEIGLGASHDGILVLPAEVTVGQTARDYFQLETDYVYEIGLTPNRSDATNHLGVARDLAAALRVGHGRDVEVKIPDVSAFKVNNTNHPVAVEVKNAEACPRFAGVSFTGFKVAESPDWLKARLRAVGVRPINNIVDVTNFVLHELGQPLHAYELKQIADEKIIVDTLPEGTPFVTLDEVERKLTATDLMICDGRRKPLCIGGVFGGLGSGVKDDTTAIFLESAHFSAQWIRRGSMHHNLRTDAAKVFEKGSDPNMPDYALRRAILLMQELAGGEVSSEVVDIYPRPVAPTRIRLRYARINAVIGVAIEPAKVHDILQAMGMGISEADEDGFTAAVPTNKADVTREIDLIEEILRIYGFNNVPIPSRITTSMALAPDPDPSAVRNAVADQLAARGFHEMMALSLSESRYYRKHEELVRPEELVYINNTSNVHLDIMRPHMVFSVLEAVLHNQNRQEADLRLFEFGRTYRREGEQIEEINHLTLCLTGSHHPESWLSKDMPALSFHSLKSYVNGVLKGLGIDGYQETAFQREDAWLYGLRYHRGPKRLVNFGRVNGAILKEMDIKGEVFYADFHWDHVLSALPRNRRAFEELNKYPSVRRDLALVVENSVKFGDIAAIAAKTGKKLLRDINLFDVYTNEDQLGADRKSYAVSFIFEDKEKTLKDKDVDQIMEQLITQYETKLGAQIRR